MTDDYRQTSDRTEPVQIPVTTEWRYSLSDTCACCPGRHVFSYGVRVEGAKDQYGAVTDAVGAAIKAFGDGAELIIEVRRA